MARSKQVLVVEDEAADVFLLRRAFSKSRLPVSLHFVHDGQEAINYLRGEEQYADRQANPLPDLILLDIKTPKLNGFEVLGWLRQQPGLKRLPVSIFSSSSLKIDVNRAYELGANSFLIKPQEPAELADLINHLEGYWFEVNQGPDSTT
jgi:CheY-like chemotaxis protein